MLQRCSRHTLPLVRSGARRQVLVFSQSKASAKPRFFSSSGPSQASHSAASSGQSGGVSPSPLSALAGELDGIAPRFEIDAEDVRILREPAEFFSVLKEKILGAKRRIYLATLYIGKTEHELIETLQQALRNNPDLSVSILTDYFRGTREAPKPCCASLLAPLIDEFGASRVEIRMWHTPNLTGFRESILPKRINEGWGLQHMKLYACDDEIIMSGANLSTDYFTNRQDRYHVFKSKELTEFYERVYRGTCEISYDVQPSKQEESGFTLTWPKSAPCASPQEDPQSYIKYAAQALSPLLLPSPSAQSQPRTHANLKKAVIYPLFQLAPVTKASTELPALTLLLSSLSKAPFYPARWTFTAGYFNMTPSMRDLLLAAVSPHPPNTHPNNSAQAPTKLQPHGTVLTAHPHANGFHGSKGVSGMLPPAYTFLASRFLRTVLARNLSSAVTLLEWKRGECGVVGGWTYHAKGLWISLPRSDSESASASASGEGGGAHLSAVPAPEPATLDASKKQVKSTRQGQDEDEGDLPCITLVGSSNYTARSHTLDLEANALILTENIELRKRLRDEEMYLKDPKYAQDVGLDEYARTERRVSWRVRVALWIVGVVGGAL